ncbi:6-phosphogluconate dehydrogenase [Sinorhizobium kostiense]|uniref:6-phosphogluconate dehydrogenase n=1 Tax=Sinorhizobium kostiense TaxID=76747 RepID=A0ABS4R0N5_9HYPH|nr:6-phosphogluconate dehydrogenase [Sinorhizobium kostiense]
METRNVTGGNRPNRPRRHGSQPRAQIAEKGYRIAVFNRTTAATRNFYADAGALKEQIVPRETIEDCARATAMRAP